MGIGFDSLGFNFSACARTRTHLRGIEGWVGIGLARGGLLQYGVWGITRTMILRNHQELAGNLTFTCEK